MTETQKLFKATALEYLEHDGPVAVIRPLSPDTDHYDPEVGPMFKVRSAAGVEFDAFADELKDIPAPDEAEAGSERRPSNIAPAELNLARRRLATKLLDVAGPSVDEVVARVMDETPDGDAFNLNDALRLAARIARGEA